VVERRFAFGDTEKEQFRIFMRMYENFSGCRILSYCIMSNHFHILLEVPPMPDGGLSNDELLNRLSAIYNDAIVAEVAKEIKDAQEKGLDVRVAEIHARYTYRMHDLSQFMKTVLQRMTQWYNRENQRTGTLWESRFTSVIVESGTAARMMAAYIDLNPVRAGMVSDPAEYRWSSYGEAIGGGAKGNGKKAREGLVRACMAHKGGGFEAEKWYDVAKFYRKLLGMALERKAGAAAAEVQAVKEKRSRKRLEPHAMVAAKSAPASVESEVGENDTVLPELKMAEMLCYRVRYFTAGAVIGSKAFVNEAFTKARERFSAKRKDGARSMKGNAAAAKGVLCSLRDLKAEVKQAQSG
jgi:REP element-mobilizing transposase RayT